MVKYAAHKHFYVKEKDAYLLAMVKTEAKRLGIAESDVVVLALRLFFNSEFTPDYGE